MFCSNCGKSLHPDSDTCQHCGANLGENRFYGNSYTSSQVRIPAEQLNEAPAGGMISYTRTNYMSYDNQPENDVYSNTTYRPLLSDEEDLQLKEDEAAAEEARRAEEKAAEEEAAQAEAAAETAEEENPAQEAPAGDQGGSEFEDLVVEESEIIEEEPAEEYTAQEPADEEEEEEEEEPELEFEGNPDGSIDPEDVPDLDPLPKASISPRVLSYMEELDRLEQKRANGGSVSLRMPSFLQNLRRKSAPVEEELPGAEDIPGEESEYEASGETFYDENAAEESADETEYADEAEYADDSEYGEEAEYADDSGYAEETEYADDETEYADEAEYAEDGEYADGETEYADEAEYAEDGEYIAEDDGFDSYEDEEEYGEEEPKAGFRLNVDFKALFQNRILQISVAAVLIVAVLAAGIYWLGFVTTKRSKIVDVTYETYTQGIELLRANITEEYRTNLKDVYMTNTSVANSSFAEDMAELNALMPAEPAANDELFITTLTIIQDAIADAVKADAEAALKGTADSSSELRWQAISNAVDKLASASTPGELTVLVTNLESVVAPTPSPSPTPAPNNYVTLTNGMMNDLDVMKMQNRLINLGYMSGTPDGDFGNGTESALKDFQRAAGLTADGIATPEVQEVLYSDSAPRVNATVDSAAAPSNPSAQ